MKNLSYIFVIAFLVSFLVIPFYGEPANAQEETVCPEGEADLNVAAGAVGQELELTQQLLNRYMELCPNVTVNALQPPDLANDRFGFYSSSLGMGSSAIDVYQIDVTWPGTLAEHFIDLYDFLPQDSETIQQHFPQIIENNTVDGRLVGIPWFTDSGLLYYRTDLLESYGFTVPETWEELETIAAAIQEGEREAGNPQFWGYVWQGNSGEATTVNALEWQASQGGGVIINSDGEVQVNNSEAIAAIERARGWIDTISPPSLLGHGPEDSRAMWEAGNAAFMRNWPYAYSLGNDPETSQIASKFDITLLPGATPELRTGTLGGWQLAVSRYTRNPDAAVSLVVYMTSPEAQKLRAMEAGLLPTIEDLYNDPEILETVPFLGKMREIVAQATARPSTVAGDHYNEVSSLYSSAVGSVLQGEEEAQNAMEDLEFDLEELVDEMNIGSTIENISEPPVEQIEAQVAEPAEVTDRNNEALSSSSSAPQSQTNSETEENDGIDPTFIAAAVIAIVAATLAAYIIKQRSEQKL